MAMTWRTGIGEYFADGHDRTYKVVKNNDYGWWAMHAEPGSCRECGEWTPIPGSLARGAHAARTVAERFEESAQNYSGHG